METLSENTWNEFLDSLEALNNGVLRTKMKFDLLDNTDQWFFDVTGQVALPSFAFVSAFEDLSRLDEQVHKLNSAYSLINSGKVGVVDSWDHRGSGDFDIVGIQGQLSDEQAKDLQVNLNALYKPESLEGPPLIIAAGIAVTALVVGAVITVKALSTKQAEIEAELDAAQMEVEKKILENPSILPDWTKYKESVQGETRSLIDQLLGPGTGQKVVGGALGLVAVLAIGWIAMGFMNKKKARSN